MSRKGYPAWNKGLTGHLTEITIKQMSDSGIKKWLDPVYHSRMVKIHTERWTPELRSYYSNLNKSGIIGMLGKEHTEETKRKQSQTALKNNEVELTCPKCGFVGRGSTMYRWHFDNCGKGCQPLDAKHPWEDKPVIECPHCGTESKNLGAMNRFHFDNCVGVREKPVAKNPRRKIQVYDKDNNFIREYKTMKDVLENKEFRTANHVYASLISEDKLAYGYNFKYGGDYLGD